MAVPHLAAGRLRGGATPGTAVLLIGVLDKVGTFGMLRYCLPLFPDASRFSRPSIIVAGASSAIIYGALLAIGQTDMMRLIAYTSVSHFGFIALGIFAFTSQGRPASTLYMVNHGFSTGACSCSPASWSRGAARSRSPTSAASSRWRRCSPGCSWSPAWPALALPGLSTFVSEFLVLVGTFTRYPVAAVVATLGIVLARSTCCGCSSASSPGRTPTRSRASADLRAARACVVAPLVVILWSLGFYPSRCST